jgi:hypothetical protein
MRANAETWSKSSERGEFSSSIGNHHHYWLPKKKYCGLQLHGFRTQIYTRVHVRRPEPKAYGTTGFDNWWRIGFLG